ncbi:MAG: tripartite tricarboxylate transporter TctB family protein [Paracoccaceae bacterium]
MRKFNDIDWHEMVAATVVTGVGIFALAQAQSYQTGSLNRMGPGYFPTLAAAVMVGLGLLLALSSLRRRAVHPRVWFFPLFAVFLSLIAWAVLFPLIGFVPATFALFAISSLAQGKFRPLYVVLATALMSGFGLGVFGYALNIPINAFWF